MKLSVVIVNYNVKYYLDQCLCSVYRAVKGIRTEVFVVDNASSDGSDIYFAEKKLPNLTYIYNEENTGFSRANNQAISQSGGEYVLLLNPDTLIPEDTLTHVIRFMDHHPQAGAVGLKMITSDGTFLPESKRGIPTPWNSFGKLMGLRRLFPNSRWFGGYHLSHLDNDSTHEVEVLAGACMFLRRSALNKCGLLDESYFMYGEDIDLSCRMLRAGYKNYYLPFPVLHYKGESTSKNTAKYIHVFYEAMDVFYCKYGQHPFVFRQLVKQGILLRRNMALLSLSVKKKLTTLTPSPEKALRFMILGSEKSISFIRAICRRNGLGENHYYMVSNEISAPNGHHTPVTGSDDFTHVIYDTEAYSFGNIIKLLERNPRKNLQLGVYNSDSRTLVTPQKCYV